MLTIPIVGNKRLVLCVQSGLIITDEFCVHRKPWNVYLKIELGHELKHIIELTSCFL